MMAERVVLRPPGRGRRVLIGTKRESISSAIAPDAIAAWDWPMTNPVADPPTCSCCSALPVPSCYSPVIRLFLHLLFRLFFDSGIKEYQGIGPDPFFLAHLRARVGPSRLFRRDLSPGDNARMCATLRE
jgi:hypothetical protein